MIVFIIQLVFVFIGIVVGITICGTIMMYSDVERKQRNCRPHEWKYTQSGKNMYCVNCHKFAKELHEFVIEAMEEKARKKAEEKDESNLPRH